MDDDEYISITIPEAFIYKVPPRTSAEGLKAADWKDQVAVVKVVVATKGKDVLIKLYRTDSEKLFAICPIKRDGPAGLEAVSDSSRFFLLRIEDGRGNHAFIGLGFNKREDAFDLKSAIADAQKTIESEITGKVDLGISDILQDFSLQQGATINISLGSKIASAPKTLGTGGLRAPTAPPVTSAPAPAPAPSSAVATNTNWVSF